MSAPIDGTERVAVSLGGRSYDILVGSGLLGQAGALMRPLMAERRAVIVTDRTGADLHLPALARSLADADIPHHAIVVPPGEETKDFSPFASLADDILALRIPRRTMLVALGRGVVRHL